MKLQRRISLFLFLSFITFSSAQSFSGDLGYAENSPLFWGNPSDALADVESEENYLMEKKQFVISYNNKKFIPNWVGWHLCSSDFGEQTRSNKFTADKLLPEQWKKVTDKDYQFTLYGFDRGHLCPSADRTFSSEDNKMTFLMTNMVPQAPDNNRIIWKNLEDYERELARQGNELYIFAGVAGTGGIGDRGQFDEIVVHQGTDEEYRINVPAFTWKVLLVMQESDDDFARIDEETQIIAVCVPNVQGCNDGKKWTDYICTVNDVELLTGIDFFELIEDELEEKLESRRVEIVQ